ncbi:hypothetical protein [Chryseobacterium bernardetii]|uniref:Uncharacterized protein n=1 Tax=Chryseobacterium bernardetii TaxID=1241978 RepID=A0A3G6T1E1_9FLAO|nr:hypothetical protein [Chryseobacterium bernardetii]AZB23281.1 hypothetical protein EG339_00935 [Chryseobacterium bernardetii]
MRKIIISTMVLLSCATVSGQIGINTSTPSAGLDIVGKGNTSATKALEVNNSSAKEMVTVLNNGNVGIGETAPTATLQVTNTTSTALRVVDGTQGTGKVLTSDASGNASWVNPSLIAISGNLPSSPLSFTSYGTGNPPNVSLYSGGTITLPAGKWLVSFGSIASLGLNDRINTSDAQLWCTAYLSDSSTNSNTTADYISAYTGQRGSGGTIGRGMNRTMVTGSIAINNTTGANKTYYLWANQELERYSGGPTFINVNATGTSGYWINVFGVGNWERYFYAIPIQ